MSRKGSISRSALAFAFVVSGLCVASCAPRRSVAGEVYATVGGEPIREPEEARRPLLTGEQDVSLEEATVLALERNPELAVQRLDPAIASTFETIERAEFGATVFVDGEYRQELARETNRATMMQFEVEGSRTNTQAGIRQRTPTGTAIETSVGFGRDESDRSPEQQDVAIALTVTQSLLEGVRPDVNLARVRQAELETRASQAELRAFVLALLRDLEVAYWELALATKSVTIFEESLALAEQEQAAVAARVEVGELAPADQPIVQTQVALRQQGLIDARAAVDGARLRLARMLGVDPQRASVDVTDAVAIEPVPIAEPDAHRALALRLRPELEEARLRVEQNELETVVTANGLLPRLDVFVRLAKTGFGSSFAEAVEGLGDPTYEASVGLSFEQLLGNARARGLDRQANLREERAQRALANLESLVRLDVDLALVEVERARAQVAASRTTAELQARVVETERARLGVGEGTALLLAQAENALLRAQVAEVEAQIAYRVALVRLHAADGSLLERRGVHLARDD